MTNPDTPLTLDALIALADEAYPEGLVLESHRKRRNVGDTLAYSIASNLEGTFEPDLSAAEQLDSAVKALDGLMDDLQAVRAHLASKRRYLAE